MTAKTRKSKLSTRTYVRELENLLWDAQDARRSLALELAIKADTADLPEGVVARAECYRKFLCNISQPKRRGR